MAKDKHDLLLRGAVNMLSRAVVHVGKGHRTNSWDGEYMDQGVQQADRILTKAVWLVEKELRDLQKR